MNSIELVLFVILNKLKYFLIFCLILMMQILYVKSSEINNVSINKNVSSNPYSIDDDSKISKITAKNNNFSREENLTRNDYLLDGPMIELYSFPFIIIIGTICNILTFLVMRRKKMRHQSTYFYMAVLAIADELVLLIGCFNYWLYLSTNESLTLISDISCKIACIALYATFHFSVWMVVIMTVERFIAVALPLQASRLCTVKRAKIATAILALIILCINAHFLFTHHLKEKRCEPKDQTYKDFMLKIWTWIDAIIYSFVPLSLLIIFNILIVYNLVKASRNIEKLNSSVLSKNKTIKYNENNHLSTNKSLNSGRNSSECQIQDYTKKPSFKAGCCFLFPFISCSKRKLIQSSDESNNNNNSNNNNKSNRNNKYKSFSVKKSSIPIVETEKQSSTSQNNGYNSDDMVSRNVSTANIYQQIVESPNQPSKNFKSTETKSRSASTTLLNAGGVQSSSSSSSSSNRRLTIMLLVVSITFCLTSMPIVTLQYIEEAGFIRNSSSVMILKGIFLSLQYLNHSINFFLYAVTGKTFRREFFSLLAPCKQRLNKKLNKKTTGLSNKTAYSMITNNKIINKDSLKNQQQSIKSMPTNGNINSIKKKNLNLSEHENPINNSNVNNNNNQHKSEVNEYKVKNNNDNKTGEFLESNFNNNNNANETEKKSEESNYTDLKSSKNNLNNNNKNNQIINKKEIDHQNINRNEAQYKISVV